MLRRKSEIKSRLENPGVIAVVRAKAADQVLPLTEALVSAGLVAIEITLTTPDALSAISRARAQFREEALIGVGTVLDAQTCDAAIQAGAQFVVSPITKFEIAQSASKAEIPVMLGAYTPTEAQQAFEAGADYIKLFPAETLGPAYIKALRAPLPHLKIVPTGGVDLNTIPSWFGAGAVAVGAGSSLLTQSILQENNWQALQELAARFVAAAAHAKRASF